MLRLSSRQWLIFIHDLAVTAAAVVATFFLRFEDPRLSEYLSALPSWLPGFVVFAGVVYAAFGLYKAKWRFASLPDLGNIFRASSVLALTLLIADYVMLSPNVYGTFYFGKIVVLLYWIVQMAFLGGPRIAYRYFRDSRNRQNVKIAADSVPTLILGRAADADVLLRAIESGAVKKVWPVGILSPSRSDRGHVIRGVPVLGDLDDLEQTVAELGGRGITVTRLVMTPSVLAPDAAPESVLMRDRKSTRLNSSH